MFNYIFLICYNEYFTFVYIEFHVPFLHHNHKASKPDCTILQSVTDIILLKTIESPAKIQLNLTFN